MRRKLVLKQIQDGNRPFNRLNFKLRRPFRELSRKFVFFSFKLSFRKDHKKDAICICISGDLPGMKETGYMEVLDDGKEPEGPHPVGKG